MQAQFLFFSLFKYDSETEVLSYTNESNQNQLKSQSLQVLRQLKNNVAVEQRQKINTKLGQWFCKHDQQNIAYIVLTTYSYPEGVAYDFIQKIQSHLQTMGVNYGQESQADIQFHMKKEVKELYTHYTKNLDEINKIHAAQSKLDDVKINMEKGVNNLINNQGKLEELDSKAKGLNAQGKQFNKGAGEVKSIMYWRNKKLQCIIFLVFIAVVLIIAIPLIVKYA